MEIQGIDLIQFCHKWWLRSTYMWLWQTAVTFGLETVGLKMSRSYLKLQMERECTENNEHYNWIMRNEPDSKRAQNVKAQQEGYQARFKKYSLMSVTNNSSKFNINEPRKARAWSDSLFILIYCCKKSNWFDI